MERMEAVRTARRSEKSARVDPELTIGLAFPQPVLDLITRWSSVLNCEHLGRDEGQKN
jgi:hypothetical protein